MKLKAMKTGSLLQWAQVSLLVIAVGLLVWSQPWSGTDEVRKISISGTGTVKAAADSYQFNPSYEETGADSNVLLDAMTAKAKEVTDKLIELGVKEDDIALQSSSYDKDWLNNSSDQTVSFYLTITVEDKELADKVQDYILTTSPTGSISPYPTFSDKKQKDLEKQAREEAIADARSKAATIAKEMGEMVGKVISIDEGGSGGDILALETRSGTSDSSLSLPILTGKQEVTVSVTVSFAIK